jgi:hypothetical protein
VASTPPKMVAEPALHRLTENEARRIDAERAALTIVGHILDMRVSAAESRLLGGTNGYGWKLKLEYGTVVTKIHVDINDKDLMAKVRALINGLGYRVSRKRANDDFTVIFGSSGR